MYIFKRALVETAKTFLIGIVCSVMFSLMIYREAAFTNQFVSTTLNTTSLFLFFYLHFLIWRRLYLSSFSFIEYIVPTITAVSCYTILSLILYFKRFFLYMWVFLPTRFLEPQIYNAYDYVSVIIANLLFFVLIFFVPFVVDRRG